MKTFKTLSARFLLLCIFPAAALAQSSQTDIPSPGGSGIALNVVVTPSSGEPVPDLPQSAFTVLDNGKPQTIQSFRALNGNTEPVKVLVVADAVNISFTRLAYERSQLEAFFHASDGQLADPTSLAVVTDTSTEATTGFTKDGNALAQALDNKDTGLRVIRRDSGFYGAEDRLGISLRALQSVIARAQTIPGRKIIVWVSPGWPLLSGPAVQLSGKQAEGIFHQIIALSTELREANITLYSVDPLGAGQGVLRTFYYEEFLKGVSKMSQVEPGDLGLQVLAVQSGGLALSSSNDVTALLQRCIGDTKAFYSISYTPPPADAPNQYHHIEVKVSEPHLTARTRQGYYSQP